MTGAIDPSKLLETIAEQGAMIEELRDDLNELVSRRVPIAISEVTVICDDGSMWQRSHTGSEWERLPDIPQPEKTEESN